LAGYVAKGLVIEARIATPDTLTYYGLTVELAPNSPAIAPHAAASRL
jgi:hypothetical protein